MKEVFIYTLTDPRTNLIRYVGQTNNLKNRLRQHVQTAINRYTKTKKNNWIINLNKEGLTPIIEVLEVSFNPNEDELYWIQQLTAWGYNLTNYSNNFLVIRDKEYSRERYEKISKTLKGKPRSELVKTALKIAHTGKIVKESTKEKLRIINKNRQTTDNHIKGNKIAALKRCIKIIRVDSTMNILEVFNSSKEACSKYNISNGYMSQHIKNIYPLCKGMKFTKLKDIV
jgi:group I intron endonuclease